MKVRIIREIREIRGHFSEAWRLELGAFPSSFFLFRVFGVFRG